MNVITCTDAVGLLAASPVKSRQQAMWASSDFAVIGTTLQIVGELLNEAVDVRSNDRVLDVAAGTFEVADAEALPYATASFDVVLSTFGVMFAPDHERVASELMRVCRPGGRIGLASWAPSGFLGQLFHVLSHYVPASPGIRSPLLWGTPTHLHGLFAAAKRIEHTPRFFAFRYRSPEHWVDVFRTYYGPVHKAFLGLDETRQATLETDLLSLLHSLDQGGAAGMVVAGEYLETVITR